MAFKLRTEELIKAQQESCRGQDGRECEPLVEPKAVLSVCVCVHRLWGMECIMKDKAHQVSKYTGA